MTAEADRLSAQRLIADLDLSPHPEGGHYRETYRAQARVDTARGSRAASTCTLYLMSEAEPSRFHRLHSDELWFYHAGALAELVLLKPVDGSDKREEPPSLPEHRLLGPASPYLLAPAGWWLAGRCIVGDETDWDGGRAPERRWTRDRRTSGEYAWTLVSCVVTPGFEFDDFEMADRSALLRDYPLAGDLVRTLT